MIVRTRRIGNGRETVPDFALPRERLGRVSLRASSRNEEADLNFRVRHCVRRQLALPGLVGAPTMATKRGSG